MALVVSNRGGGQYAIERNDQYKTPEILFVGIPKTVVDLVAATMQKVAENPGSSTWDFGLSHLYKSGAAAGPLILRGNASGRKPFGSAAGLTNEPKNGGVDQVHLGDMRPFGDGIVFERYSTLPTIDIATKFWDGGFWQTAGFKSLDAAIVHTVFAEIPHVFVREASSAMDGHGEAFSAYTSNASNFSGFKPGDVFYDDVDFINIDMDDAGGLFAPGNGRETYLGLRAYSLSSTESARALANQFLYTKAEREKLIEEFLKNGGSSTGGPKLEVRTVGDQVGLAFSSIRKQSPILTEVNLVLRWGPSWDGGLRAIHLVKLWHPELCRRP